MNKLGKKRVTLFAGRKRFVLLAVLVAVVLACSIFGWKSYSESRYQCRGGSESQIYKDSVAMANNGFGSEGEDTLAKKIEQDRGYKKDVNCLYPLISHYMKTKNEQKVEDLFALFNLYYGDKKVQRMYKDYDVRGYDDVKQQVDEFIKGGGNVDIFSY